MVDRQVLDVGGNNVDRFSLTKKRAITHYRSAWGAIQRAFMNRGILAIELDRLHELGDRYFDKMLCRHEHVVKLIEAGATVDDFLCYSTEKFDAVNRIFDGVDALIRLKSELDLSFSTLFALPVDKLEVLTWHPDELFFFLRIQTRCFDDVTALDAKAMKGLFVECRCAVRREGVPSFDGMFNVTLQMIDEQFDNPAFRARLVANAEGGRVGVFRHNDDGFCEFLDLMVGLVLTFGNYTCDYKTERTLYGDIMSLFAHGVRDPIRRTVSQMQPPGL